MKLDARLDRVEKYSLSTCRVKYQTFEQSRWVRYTLTSVRVSWSLQCQQSRARLSCRELNLSNTVTFNTYIFVNNASKVLYRRQKYTCITKHSFALHYLFIKSTKLKLRHTKHNIMYYIVRNGFLSTLCSNRNCSSKSSAFLHF